MPLSIHSVIDEQKKSITLLYETYTDALDDVLNSGGNAVVADDAGKHFFNYLEQCVAQCNSSDELSESEWNQWLAETCIDVLNLIVQHHKMCRLYIFDDYSPPSSTAYAAMQRLVARFDKRIAKEIRSLFESEKLPVYGFTNKGKMLLTKAQERLVAYVCATCFIVVMLAIAIFIPHPTPSQESTFRTVLAMSLAGFAGFLPGFLDIKIGKGIRAGGALGVFIVVYKFLPAITGAG